MLGLKELIYNILKADSTLTGIVGNNIYPSGVDAIEAYPSITIEETASKTATYPVNARETIVTVSVWSNVSHFQLDTITDLVWSDMKYVRTNTPASQKVYWSLPESGVTNIDHERRIWSYHMGIRFWTTG